LFDNPPEWAIPLGLLYLAIGILPFLPPSHHRTFVVRACVVFAIIEAMDIPLNVSTYDYWMPQPAVNQLTDEPVFLLWLLNLASPVSCIFTLASFWILGVRRIRGFRYMNCFKATPTKKYGIR
jgi:hypothetical protein